MASTEEAEQVKNVKFIYNKSDKFNLYYTNGAIGGLTPQGDIICNFYFEYKEVPKEQDAIVRDDKLEMKEDATSTTEILRELEVGVIMTPKQAKNLAEWLNGKIREYEDHFER